MGGLRIWMPKKTFFAPGVSIERLDARLTSSLSFTHGPLDPHSGMSAAQLPQLTVTHQMPDRSRSLADFIDGDDDLPEDWNTDRRGVLDTLDVPDLEKRLKEIYNVNFPSARVQRSYSAPPLGSNELAFASELPNDRLSFPGLLPSDNETGGSNDSKTAGSDSSQRHIPRKMSAWLGQITPRRIYNQLTGPQAPPPRQGIMSRAAGTQVARPLGEFLREGSVEIVDFVGTVGKISSVILACAWFLIRHPLQLFVAVWAVTQGTALLYTFLYYTVMDNFCVLKLPLVRNYVCKNWDLEQENYSTTSVAPQELSNPFETILTSKESTMTYEMPLFLRRWGSTMAVYRASLPESQLPQSYVDAFNASFTQYIEINEKTVKQTQGFADSILYIIPEHVRATKELVPQLDGTGITSTAVSTHQNGPLARFMALARSTYLDAITLMKDHVEKVSKAIIKLSDMITSLQTSLGALGVISERIETLGSEVAQSDKRLNQQLRGKPWKWIGYQLSGDVLSGWEIDERGRWMEPKRKIFRDSMRWLRDAQSELDTALIACNNLKTRLTEESARSRRGGSVPEWLKKQALILTEGVDDLETKLKNFHTEQMRFTDELFKASTIR
ncbi:uncharacterized protein KY384_002672 [Bacidia gigantensis]|uniref:uncharacterized protein n=1 Tax=Bacidia gigantensis TaxID=2732470 RepID=UPI001D040A1A|nr:uncharacterized protein KY384_002672 [Bacidia gigantensis]KAG8532794.1 hypothetical protein KY384_002672 [Bacidia gigantensis]